MIVYYLKVQCKVLYREEISILKLYNFNLLSKKKNYYFNYSVISVLTLINTTCLFDSIEQEDDSDIVQTSKIIAAW